MTNAHRYDNGDVGYKDAIGLHLMREINGVSVDLLEGKNAIDCWDYDNRDVKYTCKRGQGYYIKASEITPPKNLHRRQIADFIGSNYFLLITGVCGLIALILHLWGMYAG